MIDIYDKDEKIDLSSSEKKQLKQLANELKKHAKAAVRRRGRKKK